MPHTSPSPLERATAIAQRDQLCPIQATRCDTGEPIWFVQSRSSPQHYYLLTMSGDRIQCPCPQYQHRGLCAHTAAVRQTLRTQLPEQQDALPKETPRQKRPRSSQQRPPASRTAEERRQREDAERRERALPWTDDKPFSMWKS